jgi:hypothetical protein
MSPTYIKRVRATNVGKLKGPVAEARECGQRRCARSIRDVPHARSQGTKGQDGGKRLLGSMVRTVILHCVSITFQMQGKLVRCGVCVVQTVAVAVSICARMPTKNATDSDCASILNVVSIFLACVTSLCVVQCIPSAVLPLCIFRVPYRSDLLERACGCNLIPQS